MNHTSSKTILFITGAFVTNAGWEPWQRYFEEKGFSTLAPAHPHKDAPAAELRARHPDSAIASNRLADVLNYYAEIATSLPEKPIIIGHSLGGLITQILVNRGLAAAGVAIHPVAPQGIIPYEFSFLRAAWRALGIGTSVSESYLMSFSTWQYAFTNGMTLDEQRKSYDANVVPESKLIARDGLTSAAAVDFAKPHVPLLILSGSTDTITPAHLNYRNWKAYVKDSGSITDYFEMPGRNHYVVGLPTWKGDADYIYSWIEGLSTR